MAWTSHHSNIFVEKSYDLRVDPIGIVPQEHLGPGRMRHHMNEAIIGKTVQNILDSIHIMLYSQGLFFNYSHGQYEKISFIPNDFYSF